MCLTFDLIKLLDTYIWDIVNYSFAEDSLNLTELFEAIFIVIKFDPLYEDFESVLSHFAVTFFNQESNFGQILNGWSELNKFGASL